MAKWYSDAYDKYPVQPGDIWNVGPHRLICGDVSRLSPDIVVQTLGTVERVYVDPPWTPANQRQFYAYADQYAEISDKRFAAFLIDLVKLCKIVCPAGLVCYDMGLQWWPVFEATLKEAGARFQGLCTTYYGEWIFPAKTMAVTFGTQDFSIAMPENEHSQMAIKRMMAELLGDKPGVTYFDACAGSLVFGCAAAKQGAYVRGIELIARKLACGLEELGKLSGYEPIRSGSVGTMA